MPTRPIPWVEQRTKLALADSQREAVRVALVSKVLVITGGPGVGKTTQVNSILKILLAKTIAMSLCAPTGRAAKRLSESTGLEAKTIHRLLETDPRTGSFGRNEDAPLDCDLLVVDEISMVDVPLMRAVFRPLRGRVFPAPGDCGITCSRNFYPTSQGGARRTRPLMVSDSLVEQQVIPSKAGCGFMGQVVAGNDRPVCPMALGSGFSWLDNHEFIALVNLEIYRKRPNRLLVPARQQKLTRIDNHQGRSDALRQY